ncbi:phosphocholine cytidylyltransferase family protein [Moritella sp.]|uniref:phosphocholine cytidylyltransferase family protein n=1 Tax=Moritella sp. TaxID=78556 RepID=UPI0039B85ACA
MRPLTLDAPKCLTEVGGEPILGRLVDNLRLQGITRLVVVTGYLDHCIHEFLEHNAADFQVDYVFNPVYRTTNNIYSLWLARKIIEESFVLVESDLVFEDSMLAPMLIPDRIAISNTLPWMNGTVVELNTDKKSVKAFHVSHNVDDARQYKTVNIYSLSLQSWHKVSARLDSYVEDGRVGEYYETVFADMVAEGSLELDAVFFDENKWYEIDCMKDLQQAELMFPRVTQIGLSETVHLGRVARGFPAIGFPAIGFSATGSPANSTNGIDSVAKLMTSDNVVSINKLVPEKDL